MSDAKIHMRDIRLFNNAGMRFPVCYAGAELLDLDRPRLKTTSDAKEVTCARCLRAFAKRYPWAVRVSK